MSEKKVRKFSVVCRNWKRDLLQVYDDLTEEQAKTKAAYYHGRKGRNFDFVTIVEQKETNHANQA